MYTLWIRSRLDLVAGDRFKVLQRLVATNLGQFVWSEKFEYHVTMVEHNASRSESESRGFDSQCRQHFSLMKYLIK